ncbi:hypothetical protein [Phenylobacterium soli]|uniref:hypothetical protein n=1 Tax=Phenylobacterium soli TaxID=2170551 RepID=UPI001057A0B4|nr:hypothetical protein [Phenylobacterium soli]
MSTISQNILLSKTPDDSSPHVAAERPPATASTSVSVPRKSGCTFRVRETAGVWRVSRDGALYGEFLTRGDAVRGACFGARSEDSRGRGAEVLAAPGDQRVPHYEPHFGE